MMLVRAYLGPSEIEGLGVFSHEDIRKGDIIWKFDTRFDQLIPRSTLETVDDRTREFLERYGYDMPDYPDCLALDADEGRFMNHCDTPNLDFGYPDIGVALVDIPAGTELTCDYRQFTSGSLYFQPTRHGIGRAVNGTDHQHAG